MASYDQALAEIQQILSDDDPAAIYFAQPEWISCFERTSADTS